MIRTKIETFITENSDQGRRLDTWLVEKMGSVTRSFIQKLISEGRVTVGGVQVKNGFHLKSGMTVIVDKPEPVLLSVEPQDIPLDIIYEDSDIVVVNKPKNMVVHPAAGNADGTLVNALLYHCKDSLSDINGVIRPGIVHRIDKDTTGLLVIAKNNNAHLKLSEQIKYHGVHRIYDAIVDGVIKEDNGRITAAIGRHPINRKKMAIVKNGRLAITHFKVLERYKGYTYLRLKLETGRTHQIRVHMASIGYPVTGDNVYGKASKLLDTQGQALHARFLKLTHPSNGELMAFEAPLPDYFNKLLLLFEKL